MAASSSERACCSKGSSESKVCEQQLELPSFVYQSAGIHCKGLQVVDLKQTAPDALYSWHKSSFTSSFDPTGGHTQRVTLNYINWAVTDKAASYYRDMYREYQVLEAYIKITLNLTDEFSYVTSVGPLEDSASDPVLEGYKCPLYKIANMSRYGPISMVNGCKLDQLAGMKCVEDKEDWIADPNGGNAPAKSYQWYIFFNPELNPPSMDTVTVRYETWYRVKWTRLYQTLDESLGSPRFYYINNELVTAEEFRAWREHKRAVKEGRIKAPVRESMVSASAAPSVSSTLSRRVV